MNEYLINEKVTDGERNKNKAHCFIPTCNCVINSGEGYMVWIPSRGKRVVCEEHYLNRGMLSYHGNAVRRSANNEPLGTEKKSKLASTTIGVEIEVYNCGTAEEFTSLRALCEACFNVKMESDCTVSGEMPTDKMRGLGSISKVLQSLENHHQLSMLRNEHCGAHIHANCICVPYVRRYYHSIFLPLAEYINELGAEKREEIFGSDFREWARMINENSYAEEHSNIFNTQHTHTLEFRLPRIISYKQYMNVLKFWREVCCYINNFDFHENEEAEARKYYARKCGAELVNIARKYF